MHYGLKSVRFVSPQLKSEIARYWSLCDAASIHLKDAPAFAEVTSSKIFEAMAIGIPLLVAAPEEEAAAIVEQEGATVVIPPEDPSALAKSIAALNRNRGRLEELGARSLATAPRDSRERQAQGMMTVLERVVGSQTIETGAS